MKGRGRILEENVGRLVREAYVPARPRPAFRAELLRTFRSELRRRHGRRPRLLRRPVAVAAGLVATAAALLFVLDPGGWRDPAPAASLAELLARGDVALRLEEGPWRPATDEERESGLSWEAAVALELPAATSQLVTADGVDVRANGPASVAFASLDAASLTLDAGELSVHTAPDHALRVRLEPGTVELSGASLRLTRAQERVTVTLLSGQASYLGPVGREPLEVGATLTVLAGVPVVTPDVLAAREEIEEQREAVPVPEPTTRTDVAAPPSIRATVLDPDGAPLQAFRVGLLYERLGNEYEEAETLDVETTDGTFTITGFDAGRYELIVHAPGLALARVGTFRVDGALVLEEPIRMEVGGGVAGYVVDPELGTPVANAVVLSENDAPQHFLLFSQPLQYWVPKSTTTGPDGGFQLDFLRPGVHRLRVSAPGYAPLFVEDVEILAEELLDGLAIELRRGGAVEGRVTTEDGSPAAGATVMCVMREQNEHRQMHFEMALTDSEGNYRLEDLPTLPMLLILVDPTQERRPRVKPVDIEEGRTKRVDFASAAELVRVAGLLRDADGDPVPFHNLALFERDALLVDAETDEFEATTSLEDGTFAFEQAAPGRHLAFAVEPQGRWIRFIGEIEVDEAPETGQDLQFGPGRVTVTVTGTLDGRAVAKGTTALLRQDASGQDVFAGWGFFENGTVTFEGLPTGAYRLIAYSGVDGLGHASTGLFLVTDDAPVATASLVLPLGGVLQAVVLDDEGNELGDGTLLLIDPDGNRHAFSREFLDTRAGHIVASGIAPGVYRAVVVREGIHSAPLSVRCVAGETKTFEIRWSGDRGPGGNR